jgi:hypothetical protein
LEKGVGIVVSPIGSEEEFLNKKVLRIDGKQTLTTNIKDRKFLWKLARSGYTRICHTGSIPYSEPGPHDGQIDSVDLVYGNPNGCRLTDVEWVEDSQYLRSRNLDRLERDFAIGRNQTIKEPTFLPSLVAFSD